MAPVGEVWILVALGLFQLAVGYWWWTGPHLARTRGWIAGLFALNGASTTFAALSLLAGPGQAWLDVFPRLLDRGTNLFLLGFGLVALERRLSWRGKALIGAVGAALLVAAPFWVAGRLGSEGSPTWSRNVMSTTLHVAILGLAAALVRTVRSPPSDHQNVWLLCLSVIGFRFAELATLRFTKVLRQPDLPVLLSEQIDTLFEAVLLPAMLLAFGAMLVERGRPRHTWRSGLYDLSLTLVLAGFLFGLARRISDPTTLLVFLSLALVRPVVFVVAGWQLDSREFHQTEPWEHLRTWGIALLASIPAVALAPRIGLSTAGSLLTGLVVGGLAFASIRIYHDVAPLAPGDRRTAEVDPGALPLDPENVTLRPGWREEARRGFEVYAGLPPQARVKVDGMPRWQRILVALYGAPEGSDLPPYERTTPGLHVATHAPYATIGSEISRTNDRSDAIIEEVGGSVDLESTSTEEPLVASATGRAQGLASSRAKSYELTPLGREVTQRVIEDLGLEDLEDSELRLVVGEGYAESEPP